MNRIGGNPKRESPEGRESYRKRENPYGNETLEGNDLRRE